MLFDRRRPHAFRERRVSPGDAERSAHEMVAAAERRIARRQGCEAYAVHQAHDRTRVVAVEAWSDAAAYRQDPDADEPGAGLYLWAAADGVDPTPVADDRSGAIVIDLFRVWRPLVRPVSAFTIRNGRSFNRAPGCVGTTVLRGFGSGAIATFARWRTVDDFLAAFGALTGRRVADLDGLNREAARMTFGLIRPDYHAYDLVAFSGDPK